MEKTDLFWLGGLLDGDGCFYPGDDQNIPFIQLTMRDKDLVSRAAGLIGGNVRFKARQKEHWSDQWTTTKGGRPSIDVMTKLYDLLGDQNKDRVLQCLDVYDRSPERLDFESAPRDLKIHWLSGIVDAEGCFTIKDNRYATISLQMTDRSSVSRISSLFEEPIKVRETKNENHSTKYQVRVQSSTKAVSWMKKLRPLMSERRTARIDEILNADDILASEGQKRFGQHLEGKKRPGVSEKLKEYWSDPENIAKNSMAKRKAGPQKDREYKGVYWDKSKEKWTAKASIDGEDKFLGYFDEKVRAAHAYDEKMMEEFGPVVYLNHPELYS